MKLDEETLKQGVHVDYEFEDDEILSEGDDETFAELNDQASYVCNSCGEDIVVPLDPSEGSRQEYTEDCPVCCNPNVIFVDYDPDGNVEIGSRQE